MKKRMAFCIYCGDACEYEQGDDETTIRVAYEKMLAHDDVCTENPHIARVRELGAELDEALSRCARLARERDEAIRRERVNYELEDRVAQQLIVERNAARRGLHEQRVRADMAEADVEAMASFILGLRVEHHDDCNTFTGRGSRRGCGYEEAFKAAEGAFMRWGRKG
ncbi:MAG: hypothetical protein ABIE42_10220 [Candidatus Eisenbacteria bacterium]